ncbi:MAG: PspA/IM30 family protein [Actinobacteria bacterium]|nr:PspA/IM30 family protein [Actinomycetota bacterium]
MAQQSIIGRIAQMARANINALLDAAEDPEKMLDQMIRDYIGNISEAEEAVAQTIGNLRVMEEDSREAQKAAADWGGKAAAAAAKAKELRAGNPTEADRFENLARVALKRQITFEEQVEDLATPIAQQTEVVTKLKSGLSGMHGKLAELRTKRDELVGRAKVTEAQMKVQDALKSINVTDPTSELNRFEEKIRREEAKVAGMAEVAASSLDAQFESLDDIADDLEVERRLAELNAAE